MQTEHTICSNSFRDSERQAQHLSQTEILRDSERNARHSDQTKCNKRTTTRDRVENSPDFDVDSIYVASTRDREENPRHRDSQYNKLSASAHTTMYNNVARHQQKRAKQQHGNTMERMNASLEAETEQLTRDTQQIEQVLNNQYMPIGEMNGYEWQNQMNGYQPKQVRMRQHIQPQTSMINNVQM